MIWIVIFAAAVGAGWLTGHGDAAANARAAAEAAPADLLGALLGLTAGLYGRDRARLGRAYASPTLAYLGGNDSSWGRRWRRPSMCSPP